MVQSGTYTSHPAAFLDQPFAAPHQSFLSTGSEVPLDKKSSFPPGEAKRCKPLACTLYYSSVCKPVSEWYVTGRVRESTYSYKPCAPLSGGTAATGGFYPPLRFAREKFAPRQIHPGAININNRTGTAPVRRSTAAAPDSTGTDCRRAIRRTGSRRSCPPDGDRPCRRFPCG